jgi:hypothetical protein
MIWTQQENQCLLRARHGGKQSAGSKQPPIRYRAGERKQSARKRLPDPKAQVRDTRGPAARAVVAAALCFPFGHALQPLHGLWSRSGTEQTNVYPKYVQLGLRSIAQPCAHHPRRHPSAVRRIAHQALGGGVAAEQAQTVLSIPHQVQRYRGPNLRLLLLFDSDERRNVSSSVLAII